MKRNTVTICSWPVYQSSATASAKTTLTQNAVNGIIDEINTIVEDDSDKWEIKSTSTDETYGDVIYFGPKELDVPLYAMGFRKTASSYDCRLFPLDEYGHHSFYPTQDIDVAGNNIWSESYGVNTGASLSVSRSGGNLFMSYIYEKNKIFLFNLVVDYSSALSHIFPDKLFDESCGARYGYFYDTDGNKLYFAANNFYSTDITNSSNKGILWRKNFLGESTPIVTYTSDISLNNECGRYIWGIEYQNTQNYLIPYTPYGIKIKDIYLYSNLSRFGANRELEIDGVRYYIMSYKLGMYDLVVKLD